jgi:hypothetical protein
MGDPNYSKLNIKSALQVNFGKYPCQMALDDCFKQSLFPQEV